MTPAAYPDPLEVTFRHLEPEMWLVVPSSTSDQRLPAEITKAASRQTYLTIRFLVDRSRVLDAYRAYAYFRWLDDSLDGETVAPSDRLALVERQQALVVSCYRGAEPSAVTAEERILVDLIRANPDQSGGLKSYLENMMTVMAFDAERRGRLISQAELTRYTLALATGVTDALHDFIGHDQRPPQSQARYLAVTAAHITHMLRDTYDDVAAGYFNIPREFLDAHHLDPADVDSDAYRLWVRERVELAHCYFEQGKRYLAQVPCLRCRLAGFAYAARFEHVLDLIVADDYRLRPVYTERAGWRSELSMGWTAISNTFRRASI